MQDTIEFIRKTLKKPVVVIGLMGAGKTRLGGMLAQSLGLPFTDSDQDVEKAAGCSVAEIFERYGEPAFRDLERKVLARLLTQGGGVIATGGGAVMNEQTADLVFSQALSVWIRADIDLLVERTGRSDKRPLLRTGNPRDILQNLMDKRYPVYAKADITIDTDAGEVERTLARLQEAVAVHLGYTGL